MYLSVDREILHNICVEDVTELSDRLHDALRAKDSKRMRSLANEIQTTVYQYSHMLDRDM